MQVIKPLDVKTKGKAVEEVRLRRWTVCGGRGCVWWEGLCVVGGAVCGGRGCVWWEGLFVVVVGTVSIPETTPSPSTRLSFARRVTSCMRFKLRTSCPLHLCWSPFDLTLPRAALWYPAIV